jgi:hypothetical protein
VFPGFLEFLCLLDDERFYAGKFLLKAAGDVTRAVLKQNNKRKSENNEEDEPEKPT